MKKKILVLILITIIVGTIGYYLFEEDNDGTKRIESVPKDGFQINLLNNNVPDINSNIFGCIIRQGDWYYYINGKDNENLYKIKTDGTMRKRMNNSRSSIIGIYDDWICYIDYSDKGTLYKIKTDGTGENKLVNERVLNATVSGEWIYYITYQGDYSYTYNLSKIRIDGTGQMLISSDCTEETFVIDGDWIFYPSDGIYKVKTDRSEIHKLNDVPSQNLSIEGDWIYFINRIGGRNNICRIKTDGSGMSRIVNDDSPHLTVKDGWIYFSDSGNKDSNDENKITRIWKARADGTGKTLIHNGGLGNLVVDGDWVYTAFFGPPPRRGGGAAIYRINADGSMPDELIPVNFYINSGDK